MTYLRNYACSTSRTAWRASRASAHVQLFGAGDYSMRVWLDPQKVAERGLSAARRGARDPRAERAGRGRRRRRLAEPAGLDVAALDQRAGPAAERRGVRRHHRQERRRRRSHAAARYRADRARRRATTRCARFSTTSPRSRSAIFQRRAPTRSQISDDVRADDGRAEEEHARGRGLRASSTTRRSSFARRSRRWCTRCSKPIALVVLVVILFLQTWRASIIPLLAVPVSIVGTFAVMYVLRLLDQRADPVRAGAGDRHRGRRRDRRGRERRAQHRGRPVAARGDLSGDAAKCPGRSSRSRWC